MPTIFEYHHTITPDEIDGQGHVNNVRYVEWMQDAAVAHSASLGWNGPRYRAFGRGWVAREHRIKYLQPAYAGEEIVVRTWVANMKKVTSLRRYRIVRPSDGALLAEAETTWAFVDLATGQPTRIAREISDAYPVSEEEEAGGRQENKNEK